MKFASLLLLPLSMALVAQSQPKPQPKTQSKPAATANKAPQESEELRSLRDKFSQVLDSVNKSWFGAPYQQIKAVEINGTLAIVLSGTVIDEKIEQLTKGAVKSPGVRSGQAFCRLSGTYFANGDHLYRVNGDFGVMRFQRIGEKGFWYIQDQNVYTTAIDMAPADAPVTFMGWFASVMADISNVYVKGSTFKVSQGKETTIGGKAAHSVIFNSPTAPYDPTKREQAASDTFGFWKKGRLEIAYEPTTKQPLRMVFTNVAQGIEATTNFTYDANGRIKQVTIANRSKQWEGPGFVRATYNGEGMISAIAGELTGQSHKITFNLGTNWSKEKSVASIQDIVPAVASKLGREDMELRLAMMFAGNIGDMQRAGFNFMMPKISPVK